MEGWPVRPLLSSFDAWVWFKLIVGRSDASKAPGQLHVNPFFVFFVSYLSFVAKKFSSTLVRISKGFWLKIRPAVTLSVTKAICSSGHSHDYRQKGLVGRQSTDRRRVDAELCSEIHPLIGTAYISFPKR